MIVATTPTARPFRYGVAFALIVCLAWLAATSGVEAEEPTVTGREQGDHFCAVPPDLQPRIVPLEHVRAAYDAGQPLRIVALGTSTTAGVGAAKRGDSYPAQLAKELETRLPGHDVTVINKGVRGQTTRQMAERIEDDVLSLQPQLVIWQTGTVDTANNVEIEEFGRTLEQGIEILHKEGADVILMNMQYSRRFELIMNYEPYLEAMAIAAAQSDAILFDRFEMMRYWSESDRLNFEDVPRRERASRASRLYHCIAWQLGEIIETALH